MTNTMTSPSITIPIINSGLSWTGSSVVEVSVTLKSGVGVSETVDMGVVVTSIEVVVVVSIMTIYNDLHNYGKV